MNHLLDVIFNAEDWIEDNIKVGELGIELLENTKNVMIKNQEKVVNLYTELKTENSKQLLKKQIDETYLQLLNIDKELENAKKNLKYCKDMKNKLL